MYICIYCLYMYKAYLHNYAKISHICEELITRATLGMRISISSDGNERLLTEYSSVFLNLEALNT